MDPAFVVTAFVTLFVIVDPIGLTPVFVALTQGMAPQARRAVALRACLVAAGLLLVFGLAGEVLLGFIGISMPAFQIAGGILLFLTALDMLFDRRSRRRESRADEEQHAHPQDDPSVFPLAMPLIAGPGAMASMILLVGQTRGDWLGVLTVHLMMLVVLMVVFSLFLAAGLIERGLGRIGTLVVTRLLGMLLAALSVQFVIDGMRAIGLFGL
ncbi:MarC family protein [Alkalilacustris brevis]|uniref:MarC family protein n=1 Tax=Alkalilacustris brevis TaxID=2026338 RepID=UPI000E0CF609